MKALVEQLRGLPCWRVSVGGCTVPSFQLAFGKKIRRPRPLLNPAQPEEYRQFEGEYGALVWCTWRLDGPGGPVTSSDDAGERISEGLGRLTGGIVRTAAATGRARDLRITFANRLILSVFCDRVAGAANDNWEMWGAGQHVVITAGGRVELAADQDEATHALESDKSES